MGKITVGSVKALFILLVLEQFLFSAPSSKIKVWHRGQGNYFKSDVKQEGLTSVPLTTTRVTSYDVQYNREQSYVGMRLSKLLSKVPAKSGEDTVLLHFSNGMLIPLPLISIKSGKLDPLIATSWFNRGKLSTDFPKVFRKDIRFTDPRPLGFKGNKIVVDFRTYPSHLGLNKFNPFRYSASLVGIEFVNFAAWVNQFNVGGGKIEHGLKIFSQRCIYCHGVKNVGADFGWDFVDPLPIYKKRQAKSILFHVKYRKIDAVSRGLLMPPQFDFTEDESKALWDWMKASAQNSQRPYKK